jgi:hypothetical protein
MAELPPEEWQKWLKSLSREELLSEISREEEAQAARKQTLTEIEHSIAETLATIEKEKLPDRTRRYEWRTKRIEQLRRVIEEWNKQIARVRGVIRDYENRVKLLEAEIEPLEELKAYHEATLRFLPTFYFIQRDRQWRHLEEVKRQLTLLRRRIAGYRGYITTQRSLLYGREGVYEGMIQFRASAIAELGGHERQLRIEAPLAERLESLYEHLGYLDEQSEALKSEIEKEESRLEHKKSMLPPLARVRVSAYIIIEEGFSIWKGKKVQYPKGQFQGDYELDAYKDLLTGEIMEEKEPYPSNLARIKEEFVREVGEEFHAYFRPEDVNIAISNIVPSPQDVGKPIRKVRIARMVGERAIPPRKSWEKTLDKWLE